MGVVMALTALAIAAITPFTATESVLLMGVLCLLYCTLGGIEAVIWTDTLQTVVLLLGAIVCFVMLVSGVDGGITEFVTVGFRTTNLHYSMPILVPVVSRHCQSGLSCWGDWSESVELYR